MHGRGNSMGKAARGVTVGIISPLTNTQTSKDELYVGEETQ